nr:putative RNA-directed DNA polymerase [Tanacetum cinerariifolium]
NVRNHVIQNAVQNQRIQNGQIVVLGNANQNPNGNGNLVAARAEGNATGHNGNHIRCYNCRGVGIQLQVEDFDLMGAATNLDEIEEGNANCIFIANLMEQSGGTVEQHPVNVEETRVLNDSLYHNVAIEVEKVNTVNHKLRETNAELTTELARYKNQEKCFEISPKKYDKLERCYQKSVYQEQCLSQRINALHLSSDKQITILNEEILDLNKQLSVEKSTVSFLLEENKKLKSDFKIRKDELLDKQIQLDKKINELDNILVKTGQSIQTIHILSPKPDSFYHTEQKMALGYQNPFYLKQAQQNLKDSAKFVGDFKSLAKEADESLAKYKALELEIKCLFRAVVGQDIMSVMQNNSVGETSNLQTELERTKERFEIVSLKRRMNMLNFGMIAIATACFTQNRSIIHRPFNKTPYELINGRKPDISFLYVFEALCYPKNDREDIGKLGAKGDIGFFIGYSVDSCAYSFFNRRTKKIMETMNVSFDELSTMAFEQRSSKPGLQIMTSRQISSRLDLTYAPSTITTQQPTEGELDLLFEAMYDVYIGGQPSATLRTVPAAQAHKVRQTPSTSTSIADTAPTPTNSSSHATYFSNTSQDVDGLNSQQQHAQKQGNHATI